MSRPHITIQIPHYNNAPYLRACIDSCLAIVYPHLTINLFDDASTDETFEVIQEIDSDIIHVFRNESNIGRVANYQKAFRYSTSSDWYANLDSDDYYTHTTWIEDAMTLVAQNPEDNIVHIQSNLLQYADIADLNPIKKYGNNYYLISGLDYLKICIEKYCFSHLGSIFCVSEVEREGGYSDDCMHTDFFTAMRVALKGNILISNQSVGVWRQSSNNQSSTRYSEEEYQKNEAAYYRFFEWSEDYLSLKDIQQIIESYESREFEKRIELEYEKNHSIANLIQLGWAEKKFNSRFLRVVISNWMEQFDYAKSILQISHGLLTKLLTATLTFIMTPILVHSLGLENYGWIGVYTQLISATYIFDLGLTSIITKEVAQHRTLSTYSQSTIIATLETIYYVIGLGILIGLHLAAPYLSTHWFQVDNTSLESSISIIRYISWAIFFQWPHSFYSGALFGIHRQQESNYSQAISSIVKNLILASLVYFQVLDIRGFFYIQIAIGILTTLQLKYQLHKALPQGMIPFALFSWGYLRHIRSLTLGVSIIGLFGFIYTDLANLLLSKWLNLSDYGLYNIVFNVVVAIIMLTASIKNSLFPDIALSVDDSMIEKREKYRFHFNTISYICIPLMIFVAIYSEELLKIWFQNEEMRVQLKSSLQWISLGSLFYSLMIIPWAYLLAYHRTRYLFFHTLILAIIAIPILRYIVYNYGYVGGSIYWFLINFLPSALMIGYAQNRILGSTMYNIHRGISIPVLVSCGVFMIFKIAFVHFMASHETLWGILSLVEFGLIYYILYLGIKKATACKRSL